MKKIITFFFLFYLSVIYPQSWKVMTEPQITGYLNDIYMVDDKEGWLVGNGGLIIHTTDGFQTFEVQVSNVPTKNLMKVFFVSKNEGWIGTDKGSLLKTIDGGKTWTESDFSKVKPANFGFSAFSSLYFVDKNLGFWVAGKSRNEFIFKTIDGGNSWSIKDSLIVTSGTSFWTDIRFYDSLKGVVVGDDKGVQKYTTNGGESWIAGDGVVYSPFRNSTVRYLSENELVCLGEGNEFNQLLLPIFKSTNGGKNWVEKTNPADKVYDRVKDIYFKDNLNGVAVGNNGFSKMFVYKTSDGGETWQASTANFSAGFIALEGYGNIVFALGTNSHIFKSNNLGTTWTQLSIKSPASFTDLAFVGKNGFAINLNGDFYFSNNDGVHWQMISTTGIWNAGALNFVNETTGILLKENRHILKTTDRGITWTTVADPVKFSAQSKVGGLSMVNQNIGYAWLSQDVYANYYIYKTIDGGATWSQVYNDPAGAGYISGNLIFFSANQGIMAGPRFKVGNIFNYWLKVSTDGGTTWMDATIVGKPPNVVVNSFNDASLIDENTAVAVSNKAIYKTINKGLTWNYINHGVTETDSSFSSVAFQGQKGVILLSSGDILLTADGGATWIKNSDGRSKNLNNVAINSLGNPVFTSSNGYIHSYELISGIESCVDNITSNYLLFQNYPNPFNPTTRIEFSIPFESKIKLEVYDLLGQKVATLFNGIKPAGQFKFDFVAAHLSTGIYIYRLTTPTQILSRKMIFLK
ncbi:MAG: YCF48-related protein [Bacteroidota bacterium]